MCAQGLRSVCQQSNLIDALQEIKNQEGNLDCFTEKQKAMLEAASSSGAGAGDNGAHKNAVAESQKKSLNKLVETVKTYYLDWHKFVGRGLKKTYARDIEELLTGSMDASLDELILYFTDQL